MNSQQIMQQIFQNMLQQNQQVMAQPLPTPPTEDELKRAQLRKALAEAGKTMATTPGNFLTGLSAGAAAGGEAAADMHLKQIESGQQQHNKAMDDRMKMMRDLLSAGSTMSGIERGERTTNRLEQAQRYQQDRNTRLDAEAVRRHDETMELRRQQQEALEALRGNQHELNEQKETRQASKDQITQRNEDRRQKIALEKLKADKYKALGLDNEFLGEDERNSLMSEYKAWEAQVEASMGGAAPKKPSSIKIGTTATNPNTGEKVRWNGKQWVPVT